VFVDRERLRDAEEDTSGGGKPDASAGPFERKSGHAISNTQSFWPSCVSSESLELTMILENWPILTNCTYYVVSSGDANEGEIPMPYMWGY